MPTNRNAPPAPPAGGPNPKIDKAINALLAKLDTDGAVAVDDAVRVVNAAVAWEKVKYHIRDEDGGFDPDNL